jgi:hypothetical protein
LQLHYLVLSTYEMYNPISAVVVAMEQYPGIFDVSLVKL